MSYRDSLLPLVNDARAIVAGLGMHQTRVFVRSIVWSGGAPQSGTPAITDLEILPTPHVKATAGDPVMLVGPVTPAHAGGGYTLAQLNPPDAAGFEYLYVLLGPDGVMRGYKLDEIDTTRPLRYMLKLQSLDRVVPF